MQHPSLPFRPDAPQRLVRAEEQLAVGHRDGTFGVLAERVGGEPLDKNTDIGAINSRAQHDRTTALVQGGVEEGVVWANTCNKFDPTSPFGGYKESGFGCEGGAQGLLAYLRLDG